MWNRLDLSFRDAVSAEQFKDFKILWKMKCVNVILLTVLYNVCMLQRFYHL